ncbi:hypothetical protein JCM33374_g5647 [Metschnikowia sp. JCM 33374]|nr:hypothetical protein JCM33374_g5647 [Metschnikowia sp. JCM 33374]
MSAQPESTSENATPAHTEPSNGSHNRQGGSGNGRNRSKRTTKERNKPSTPRTNTKEDLGNKGKSGKTSKQKGESKDFRYLEVVKLVRKHLPITINGYSVAKILETHSTPQNPESETSKKTGKAKGLSRKAKETILVDHIQSAIKRDPQQPLYLSFIMKPADPDFPFELDSLNFNLTIPAEYPRSPKAFPSIVVLNSEIPRGFSVNIERGFRTIVNLAKNTKNVSSDEEEIKLVDGKGLLSQVQTLNKYLEIFLQQEKRQTMKFVTFKSSSNSTASQTPVPSPAPTPALQAQEKMDLAAAAFEEKPVNVTEATRLKREFYIGEMMQKLGSNVKLFNRSKAEARYKVQLPIVTTENVPRLWTFSNNKVDIFVTIPNAYPEVPIRAIVASNFSSNLLVAKKNVLVSEGYNLITLVEEARTAEKNFNKNASQCASENITGLVQHLNGLSNQLSMLVRSEKDYREWIRQMASLG